MVRVRLLVQFCCVQNFGARVDGLQRIFACVEEDIFEHEEERGIEDRLGQFWCNTCLLDAQYPGDATLVKTHQTFLIDNLFQSGDSSLILLIDIITLLQLHPGFNGDYHQIRSSEGHTVRISYPRGHKFAQRSQ